MARKPRIEFPGAVYHVTARGNAQGDIFIGDDDRVDFLQILEDTVLRCRWVVHAYCLMTNHYHLLVETPEANLGRGMQLLSGTYTTRFNRRNNRVGHVFQGRYKAILIEKESHLLEVSRYIALNPVKAADMVQRAEDYQWSSYRATVGLTKTPDWLTTDEVLGRFDAQRKRAQAAYVKFVDGDVKGSIFKDIRWGLALGSDRFLEELKPRLEESVSRDRSARFQTERKSLAKLIEGYSNKKERDQRMLKAHDQYGYTLEQIGEAVGMHYTSVSRAMKRARERGKGWKR